jgi:ADP-heptose:LPS heptosyltransferase
VKRVLVVNPFGIGDAIFTLTFVEALRARRPDAFIGFVCNERTRDVVRLDSSIDRTYVYNRDLFRRLWKRHPFLFYRKLSGLLQMIRQERYDTLFDLSLGREYSFLAWWLRIPLRIGFDYKGRGLFLNRKLPLQGYAGRQAVLSQLELLTLAGEAALPAPPARLPLCVPAEAAAEAGRRLRQAGIREADPVVGIAPGGGRSWGANARFKQWDAARFAEAAAAQDPRTRFVVLGDRQEEPLLRSVASSLGGRAAVSAGEPLDRVCAYLSRCKALLCNDGGLLHLANALGTPTVAVFGPVNAQVYGPYGADVPHEVLTAEVPCRPCYRDFRFPPCPHDRRCLSEIPAEKAAAALKKIA